MKKTIMIIMAVVGVGFMCAASAPERPRTRPKLASPRSLVQLNRTLVDALNSSKKTGGAIDLLRKRLAKNARVAPVELVYDAIDQLVTDMDQGAPVVRKLKKYQTALVDGNISHAVMIDKRERPAPAAVSGRPGIPSDARAATIEPREGSLISPAGGLSDSQEGRRPQGQYMRPEGRLRPVDMRPSIEYASSGRPQMRPPVERGDWPHPPASRPASYSGYQAEMRPREREYNGRQETPPPPAMIAALLDRIKDQSGQSERDQDNEEAREQAPDLSIQDIRMLVAQAEQSSGRPAVHAPHVDLARIQGASQNQYDQEPQVGMLPSVPTSSPLLHSEVMVENKPNSRPRPATSLGRINAREAERFCGRDGAAAREARPTQSLEDIVREALAKMPADIQADLQAETQPQQIASQMARPSTARPAGAAPLALVHEKGASVFVPQAGHGGSHRPERQSGPSMPQSGASGSPTGLYAMATSGESYVPSIGRPPAPARPTGGSRPVAAFHKPATGPQQDGVIAVPRENSLGSMGETVDASVAGLPHIGSSEGIGALSAGQPVGEDVNAEEVSEKESAIHITDFAGFGPLHSPIREMPPEEFLDHLQLAHGVAREELAPIPANINSLSVGPIHAPSREFDESIVERDAVAARELLVEKQRREELLRPATDFLRPGEKPKTISKPQPKVAPQPRPEDSTLTTKKLVVDCDATICGSASVGGCLDLGGFGVFDARSGRFSSDCREKVKPCPNFFLGSEDACALSNRLHVEFSSSPILFIDTQELASSATPLFGVLPIDTMFSGRLKLAGCTNALVSEPGIKVIPVSIGNNPNAAPTWVDMNLLFSVDLGSSFKGPVTAVGIFEEGRDFVEVVQAALQSGLIVYPPSVYFSKSECGTLNVLLKLTFFQFLLNATGSIQAGVIARAAEAAVGVLTTGSVVIFYEGVPST